MKSLFKPGKSLNSRPQKAASERRQVTVLFYDIIGSTTVMQSLGDEEAWSAMSEIHDLARSLIEDNLGSLEQVMGDGGMAYFGFRHVLEDSAHRAVDTACALLEARAETSLGLNIRIGIATGVVVLPSGANTRLDTNLGAVGVAPNLAARLEAASEPNTCLVSETTYRLSRRAFGFEKKTGLELKGLPDVTEGWRLTERVQSDTRFEQARQSGTPLIGRIAERTHLTKAWAATCEGHGGARLYIGEPGVGKSRMVQQAVREATGARRIILQCQPSTSGEALFSVLQMFERAYAHPERDPELAEAAMAAATLLSDIEDSPALSAEARRAALVAGLVDVLRGLCTDKPCLIVAEDLHWVDEVTLDVLKAMSAAATTLRLAILATARPDGDLDELSLIAPPTRLSALTDAEIGDLAQSVSDVPLTEDALAWIVDKSDGNPLFATELVSYANDLITEAVEDSTSLAVTGVDSLRDLLAARLDTTGRAKRTAQIASVIGRDFPFPLLVKLAEDRLTASEIEADLDRLLQHGINELVVNGETYSFRHVLVRDEAYDSQLRAIRRGLHERIVEIVTASPDLAIGIPDEVLAEHCFLADRLTQGVETLILGAERALRRSARTAPRRMLERALSLIDGIEDPDKRRTLALQTVALLGPVVTLLSGPRAAAPIYERGQALCLELDPGQRGAWFPLLWGWWFTAPDLIEQASRSEALVRDIGTSENAEARLQALHCSWATLFDGGNHARSLSAVEDGLALYDPVVAEQSRYLYGHDARVCGLGERAQSLWMQGNVAASTDAIRQAEAWADETAHVASQLHALDMAMLAASFRRDFPEIQRLLQRISALCGADDLPVITAKQGMFQGWMLARAGDARGGVAVRDGLAALRALGALEDTPIYADIAADTALLTGSQDGTLDALEAEITACKDTHLTFWLPELLRRRALVLRATDPAAKVGPSLEEGLQVAIGQEAHMLVLRNALTWLDLGEAPPPALRSLIGDRLPVLPAGAEVDRLRHALGL